MIAQPCSVRSQIVVNQPVLSLRPPPLRRLLNYVLCRRDERISVEIKARDRSRIGDSASIPQRRDRPRGAVAGRMTYFKRLIRSTARGVVARSGATKQSRGLPRTTLPTIIDPIAQ